MKEGVKTLKRVTTVGLVLVLTNCGASGTLSQNTAERGQGAETEATGGDASTTDLPTLRIAMMPFIISLPTEYIRKNKLNERAGFKMDTIMFITGTPINEAPVVDLWNVGTMGVAAMTSVANYDIIIIGEVLESTDGLGVFAKPDSPVAQAKGYNPSYPNVLGDPETVKGMTILLPIGTAQHFTALKWLGEPGPDTMDVNIINMDTAQAHQVFQANQRDAVALNVPTFPEATNDGMVQVGNLADLGTRYMDMVVVNREAVEGKQGLVQKYIDCVREARKALNDNLDTAANLTVDFLKDAGAEASRESCVSDLDRVYLITVGNWKDREAGNFAKKLGELYISLGQLEPELIDRFNSNTVSDFMKSGN